MKRKLRIIIALVIVFTFISQSAALAASSKPSAAQEQRLQKVFSAKLNEISNSDRVIDKTKQLQDFSGNLYTLVECSPIGYMIYSNDSGLFVEYSVDSPSPYQRFNSSMFYGGPTQYFIMKNNSYVHTVLDETYALSEADDLSKSTDKLKDYYKSTANQDVLNYIQKGILPNSKNSVESMLSSATESSQMTASIPSSYYVTGATPLSTLTTESQMGYRTGNVCGYIAAGLLMLWYRTNVSSNYLASSYINKNSSNYPCFSGSSFTSYLLSFGYPAQTWAYDIANVLEDYTATRGISINSSIIDVLPLTSMIKSDLYTYNRPYILFGSLVRPNGTGSISHAVLVYGYNANGLICHYGWENYAFVNVSGIWASGYQIQD